MHRTRRMARVDLDQRNHGEHDQYEELERQQHSLGACVELDADVTDQRHQRDPGEPDDRHRGVARRGVAEQRERIGGRDLSEVRHHEDVGDDDRPAALPAPDRPHRLGHPGECGAAVGVCLVQEVVGESDRGHREERNPDSCWCLEAEAGDRCDVAERRRQAVARSHGCDADDDVRHEADGVRLQLRPLYGDFPRPSQRRTLH